MHVGRRARCPPQHGSEHYLLRLLAGLSLHCGIKAREPLVDGASGTDCEVAASVVG